MFKMKKIIRATTAPISFDLFEGAMSELSDSYDVQYLSSPGPELDSVAIKYNIKVHPVEMYRRLSPMKDLKSLFQLIKVFSKEKPDMIHSMTPKAGLLCMMAAYLTRVPVRVHTFTGLVWPTETGFKRKLLMLTDKVTCFCATHIIPEGEGVKNDLLTNGITKKPIHVLGYGNVKGVDMNRFSRRPEVMSLAESIKNTDVFTFVFVGRIVRDKGINELCEAFERLKESKPSIRLLLVGQFEDDLDPISDKTREIIHNDNRIEAVGPKLNDELLAYYAASDCLVLPSYREGFPNTVLEAGAMDLPCIVTDINGSREIINDGVNGLIVPSKNGEALYHAMDKMVSDKNMRIKMATNSREIILKKYDHKFVQKCITDFYSNLLK